MVKLKELRLEKNLTTTELGKIIGCSNPTITHYERGDREPSLEMLCKLADFFECSVDYLIGHENHAITDRPMSAIAENFIREYGEFFSDETFQNYARLYKVMTIQQRIFVLGLIAGYLEDKGINVKKL